MRQDVASEFRFPNYLQIVVLFATLMSASLSFGAAEKILHSFNAWPHGEQPSGGLIADSAGNLYGAVAYGGTYGYGAVYKLTPGSNGYTQTLIYSLGAPTGGNAPLGSVSGPASPVGTLLMDSAGNLYGAATGGTAEGGFIFELVKHSNGQYTEKTLRNFHGEDGFNPNGGFIFDKAGNLYGTTENGGGLGTSTCIDGGCGTVFELSPQANGQWSLTTLYRFTGGSDGSLANANVVFDSAGNLYGSTRYGGDVGEGQGHGVLFEVSPSAGSWTEKVIYAFTGGTDGGEPDSIISDGAGNLYGVAAVGGSSTACSGYSCGAVFELSSSGGTWTENVLYSFPGTDGEDPSGALTFGGGKLLGTTRGGGTLGFGTVFELTPSNGVWSESVLWDFTGGNDGWEPSFGVTLGSAGQLFSTAIYGGGNTGNGTVIELTATHSGLWKETTLDAFADGSGDSPVANMIFDSAGNLYGTNSRGGKYGFGSVYELTPSGNGTWKEQVIYSFPTGFVYNFRADGAGPSGLVFDAAGNLYGETQYGGSAGFGSVFELSPVGSGWVGTTLYSFAGGADGVNPQGGLVLDAAGNLYGTTQTGGTGTGCHKPACGTVFELTRSGSSWTKTTLYNFQGGTADAEEPVAGLVFDSAGNLYGTTEGGGVDGGNNCGIGCGAVFELSPSGGGWKESVLHFFTEKGGDGAIPEAGLVIDAAGNLYGTTPTGGLQNETCGIGCGMVYEVSPVSGGGWKETIVYKFTQSYGPLDSLIFDRNGNLYGTTPSVVFELSPSGGGQWNETTLYTFGALGSGDGYYPEASLVLDEAGNLYGTTASGGSANGGTVFEILP
jgi:uncharacterized repeat protein (TIGR03803 family)